MPALAMTASAHRQATALVTGSLVSGLSPPSASVAPMTARSVAVTVRQLCLVYRSSATAGSQ